jgi:signal transduction histidine kinase
LTIAIRDPGGDMLQGHISPLPRPEQPLTRMARSAIAGHSEVDIEGYRDYRGVTVVGAWTWDGDLGFGLAVEVNKAEAYALLDSTRKLTLGVFGTGALGALCLAGLLSALARKLHVSMSREQTACSSLEAQHLRVQHAESELDAVIRARDDFLRNASHELRTPITSLTLLYQHLLRGIRESAGTKPSVPQIERFLSMSDRQFSRLNQLIDNLLDVAKQTAAPIPLNLEELDLGDIVREAAGRTHQQLVAAGSRVELDLGEPVVGHWDRVRTRQAVCNLLANAARFGLGKPVRVELRRVGDVAHLRVEDNGIGVAEGDLDRIFDRSTTIGQKRDVSGLGLGLHVARAIVEAHGGTIHVESTVGKGTTFSIELPLPPSFDDDPAPRRQERGGSAPAESG